MTIDHAPKDVLLAAADKISCQTALHLVIIYHHLEIVELVIRNGANPNLQDGYGKTCLDWARQDDQSFSRMGKAHISFEPTDEAVTRVYLMTTVTRIQQARFSNRESRDYLNLLGRCLFLLGDYEADCIVFEQRVSMTTGTIYHSAVCDSCDEQVGILGNRYVCSKCAD